MGEWEYCMNCKIEAKNILSKYILPHSLMIWVCDTFTTKCSFQTFSCKLFKQQQLFTNKEKYYFVGIKICTGRFVACDS